MVFRSFLSPLDGYTDLAFRLLCQRYGADAACVPLVNSTAIAFDSSKISMVDAHADEKNIGIQLVGNDPKAMGTTAGLVSEKMPFVRWLNVNCGCPSVRTRGYGGGSALLAHPEKISALLIEIRKHTDVPVSVKIRILKGLDGTVSLCRLLEEAGADFIIIHGRTPEQHYSGKADWGLIGKIKQEVSVPVVGNGDIKSAAEGRELAGRYCDSFMVGRAAMANPMLFSDREPDGMGGRFGLLDEYLSLHREYVGEPSLKDVKLKAMNFVSGVQDARKIRNRIARADTIEEILVIR